MCYPSNQAEQNWYWAYLLRFLEGSPKALHKAVNILI
jgi:hypothetical protein